jgi:crotonobetaine/carnitine-CoA ligase
VKFPNTIADILRDAVARHPKQTFLIFDGRSATYEEVDQASNRVGNWLLSQGIKKGQIVASYMSNSIEHAVTWLGCAKIGAIFAAVNTSLRSHDLAYTLGDLKAGIICTEPSLLDILADAAVIAGANAPTSCVVVSAAAPGDSHTARFAGKIFNWAALQSAPPTAITCEQKAGDPIGILYTGGSTGMPKGVLLPNGWYTAGAVRFSEFLQPKPGATHFGMGQLFHANGTAIDILGPAYCGMSAVIAGKFTASTFWENVRAVNGSTALMVGPMITVLVNAPPKPDDHDQPLRRIIGGTGQIAREIRDEFERRFGVEIIECYAQTESGPLIVGERPGDRPYLSNGHGHGWTDLKVVDPNDELMPVNQIGEICTRPCQGNTAMLGYHNKPEVTVAAWKDLWFHTGDLGFLDQHGRLHFVGRKAHSIRRFGENISAFEVEQTIALHPAVADVAVVGVPSEVGEEEIKAFIQLKDDHANCQPGEFVEHCRSRIAKFKIPRYIEYVKGFPRSATKQEIERHVLRAQGIGTAWDREASEFAMYRKSGAKPG